MPGLFDPLVLRGMTLPNRIMMAPMCMYSATEEGQPTNWHKVHYGARAVGGTGLIMFEATAVESRGRLSANDLGLWSDQHIEPLKEIVDFARPFGSRVGVQLAHGGRKSYGGETLVAPSAIPFNESDPAPHELSKNELVQVIESWAQAAARAVRAGFDCIELHGAHGYLLNEFLSPLANQRADQYGGSLEKRARFAIEVIEAVRGVIPEDMPLLFRVSAVDHAPQGVTLDEMVYFASRFGEVGVDLIDVSSGGVVSARPSTYPGYQVEYARVIREGSGLPTGAVGLITEPEFAEAIVQSEWADLVILGRELLRHPYWPLEAARQLGIDVEWPKQYRRARL